MVSQVGNQVALLEGLDDVATLQTFDRGIAGKERLLIRPHQFLQTAEYSVLLGLRAYRPRVALPIRDCSFWLGNGIVGPDDYVFIYTGSGEATVMPSIDGKGHAYVMFWGRATTVFTDPNVVPMLVKIGAILIGESPLDGLLDVPQR